MAKRKIIKINEKKCNGCGLCIPNCPEGALQIIDGKARLVSDLFCDGLGACIGHCPKGAIKIEEREAEPYNEKKVMNNIVEQGKNTIKAHLEHLKEHGETNYLNEAIKYLKEKNIKNPLEKKGSKKTEKEFCGCPGSKMIDFRNKKMDKKQDINSRQESELRQWPVQLSLVNSNAPYFKNVDLLLVADCVPFAYANFHSDFLKNKALIIGCPKLDDAEFYEQKLTDILKNNNIKAINLVNMEVPCCFGLQRIAENAIKNSGKIILLRQNIITIQGGKK
ncbi:MAG: 4Fe-4S binding protein [Nanoarchaeota archaeon]|nr:4Fe-4S binding protein [Nanoarchaeota archaeon]